MRTWPGLAALGAGIVHLGIAAGSPVLLLIPLVLVGAAELFWGVAALARPALPLPMPSLIATAVVVALWVVSLLLPVAEHHAGMTAPLPVTAMAGAGVLDLAAAVLLAVHLRRGRPSAGESPSAFFLLPAAVAAVVVAVITITSLAGTSVSGTMRM